MIYKCFIISAHIERKKMQEIYEALNFLKIKYVVNYEDWVRPHIYIYKYQAIPTAVKKMIKNLLFENLWSEVWGVAFLGLKKEDIKWVQQFYDLQVKNKINKVFYMQDRGSDLNYMDDNCDEEMKVPHLNLNFFAYSSDDQVNILNKILKWDSQGFVSKFVEIS